MHRPSSPTPYRRRAGSGLAVAAAAVLAVTSLSSCRADQVGTAAIVDGESISVDELQDETASYLEAVPDGNAGDAQHAILLQMIVSTLVEKAADSAGVSVSAGEVAAQRDQALDSVREPAAAAKVSARAYLSRQLAQSQTAAVVPPDQLEQFIRTQLLASKLGESDPAAANDAITAAAEDTDIEVNPRYGRWDPQQGLAPLVSGGLSKTVEELSGDASAQ
jgi:SurA N-terminal domain